VRHFNALTGVNAATSVGSVTAAPHWSFFYIDTGQDADWQGISNNQTPDWTLIDTDTPTDWVLIDTEVY
jgi:hypothetical protein